MSYLWIYEMSFLWNVLSKKCPFYEMSYLRNVLSKKCLIYEMSFLWNFLSMEMSYLWNVLSMRCTIYEMSCLWNVLSMKCLSMKCPNAIFLSIKKFTKILSSGPRSPESIATACPSFLSSAANQLAVFLVWQKIIACQT